MPITGISPDTDLLQAGSLPFQEPGCSGWMRSEAVGDSLPCVSDAEGVLEQGVSASPLGSETQLCDLRQITLDFFGSQFSHL